jgi:hypothetical protein
VSGLSGLLTRSRISVGDHVAIAKSGLAAEGAPRAGQNVAIVAAELRDGAAKKGYARLTRLLEIVLSAVDGSCARRAD